MVFADADRDLTEDLTEKDSGYFLAMSRGSWYYAGDLSRLWGIKTQATRNAIARLNRADVLVSRQVDRDHNRIGAPTTLYARADSFLGVKLAELRAAMAASEEESDDGESTDETPEAAATPSVTVDSPDGGGEGTPEDPSD